MRISWLGGKGEKSESLLVSKSSSKRGEELRMNCEGEALHRGVYDTSKTSLRKGNLKIEEERDALGKKTSIRSVFLTHYIPCGKQSPQRGESVIHGLRETQQLLCIKRERESEGGGKREAKKEARRRLRQFRDLVRTNATRCWLF